MLGSPKLRCLDQPVTVSIEALVPPDHFYRFLDAKLDLSFVRDWVRDCYAERGRPSIDPVVFFKLQLVLFFEGIRSERQLMRLVADRLSVRWYLGYALDEPLPDHSSLTRIRTRLGLPIFQRFFEYVVELCQQAGLVWGKELFFDATKIQANADIDSLRSHWSVAASAHLRDLFAGAAGGTPPWALPEPDNGAVSTPVTAEATLSTPDLEPTAPPRLPFDGSPGDELRLAMANQVTWRLLDERRRNPDASTASRGYQRLSDAKVSTTDPDATPMRRFPGDAPKLGYHDHYVVDGGKARIILWALITPADVMENTPMVELYQRVCFRWQLRPKRAVGDATYGTIENIRALEDAGTRAYLAMRSYEDRTPFYSASRFQYDAERDEYRCPQGHTLTFARVKWTEDAVVYRADPTICEGCPVRRECTDSKNGRIIQRSLYADYLERVRRYHDTEGYQKARRKRAVWVEPLFGEAKVWHGLRRFRLRGLWKVNTEGLLVAAGQNLKRWLSRTGWGRRYGPARSLALSPFVLALATSTTLG